MGRFGFVLVGVPVACAAVAVVADHIRRATALPTWAAGLAMLGWSLITALGLGY